MADFIRLPAPGTVLKPISPEFPSVGATGQVADGSFADLFKKAINETSGLQDESRKVIEAFVRGEPVELHQVMAATEEAAISLELLVEIRNKLTEAYRSVMNMS